jgi:trehalose 2-sulfotransferase
MLYGMTQENRIADAFPAGKVITRRTISAVAQETCLYVIFIIARSGSTLLTELAERSGLGTPQEWFNEEWIHGSEAALNCLPPRSLGTSDIDKYVERITQEYRSPQGIFGTQLSQYQTRCISELFEDGAHALQVTKPFYLRRKNLIAQAISLDRSVRSGLFHSYQKTPGLVSKYNELEYNADSIEHWCRHLLADEAFFAEFFAEKGMSPENIFYEDLIADPQAELNRMSKIITGQPCSALATATLAKLGDDKSAEWETRFRHERADRVATFEADRNRHLSRSSIGQTMTTIQAGLETNQVTPTQHRSSAVSQAAKTQTPFGTMLYLPNDDPIGESLAHFGEWAKAEIDLASQFIPMGSTVIDVGANIGTHSLPFARCTGRSGKVIAFEPQPAIFELLSANVAENELDQVDLIQAGASSSPGEMSLPELDYNGHINSGAVALGASNGHTRVATIALDSLQVSSCNFIKIDAEGMELDVLKGATRLIREHSPTLLLEVNTVERAIELFNHTRDLGYDVYFVRTKAFNPDNFKASTENFFGVATEMSLLCIRKDLGQPKTMESSIFTVFKVDSSDTLVALLIASPRFGDLTAHDRDPHWLRKTIAHERAAHGETVSKLEAASYRARLLDKQIDKLDAEIRVTRQQLQHHMDQGVKLIAAESLIASLQRELDTEKALRRQMYQSTSWRVTRPLRGVRRLMKAWR